MFKITPAGKLTTLYSFAGAYADGNNPTFPVFQASNGEFYGVASSGGAYVNGTFFRISSAGSYATLASFQCSVNGCNPNLPTQGSDGNFYGTTYSGGPNSGCCGTVYKVTASGTISVLYTFPSGPGSPVGQLVEGSDGNFWGVTNGVPFISCGELFKVSPSGDFTVFHTFNGVSGGDGCSQDSSPIAGSDGNLYGVTNAGGTANYGTIYEVNPSTGAYEVLYGFCSSGPCTMFSPGPVLLQDTNGTFYGNTEGNSDGGSWFFSFDTGLGSFVRTLTQSGDVGAIVTFLGQDFTGTTEVEFGGVEAEFKVVSETELGAEVPAAAATGPVTVVTPGGNLTTVANFKVLPKINSFSPPSGSVGTQVTINGSGFTQVVGVGFGDSVPATNVKVVSNTQITADVPNGAKTGPIYVETKGGIAASPADFTVTP